MYDSYMSSLIFHIDNSNYVKLDTLRIFGADSKSLGYILYCFEISLIKDNRKGLFFTFQFFRWFSFFLKIFISEMFEHFNCAESSPKASLIQEGTVLSVFYSSM